MTEKQYVQTHEDEVPYRLKYFRGNMPPKFNSFMERLIHHKDEPGAYVICLDGDAGKLSSDREVRAKIQGYATIERIKRPFYKIKWKYNDLKRWCKYLSHGNEHIYVSKGVSTLIEGDDIVRTQIRKLRTKFTKVNKKVNKKDTAVEL